MPRTAGDGTIKLELNPKMLALILSGMGLLILFLGGLTIFLMIRLNDRHPEDKIRMYVGGEDGSKVAKAGPGVGHGSEAAAEEVVKIGENFEKFEGKPSALPGSWTAFRGDKYDNVGPEGVALADKWPKTGPPTLWPAPIECGEGYAGVAVHKGRVFLLDYDDKKREEALRCFSLDDGKEIWRRTYKVRIVNNHAFTRTVPAVTEKYIVTMGPKCHVMCVDTDSGDFKWGIDLVKDYGTKVPEWYTAQCPIIDGTTAIIAPGGPDVLIMGVDCETGKILWKTPNPKNLKMSHASIVPMTVGGKKTYVYCAAWGKLMGFSAGKDDAGTLLWETGTVDKEVIAPSPVIMDDGYIFMCAGYSAGSSLVRVTEEGGKLSAKLLWKQEPKDGASCEQQTPIYYKKHIFVVMPDSSGGLKQQLVCMNPYDNGKIVWASGKEKRFGQYESFVLADGKLYIMSKDCVLTLVRASTEKYEELSQFKILQGHDPWAPIALANGRMLVRDSKKLICINVDKGIE